VTATTDSTADRERHCLIVEDEPVLASLLDDVMRDEGFLTTVFNGSAGVVSWIRDRQPTVVLLDLMLPGADGFSICREIRSFSRVPLIMITARNDEADRLRGLDLGADDYVCKPFHAAEVAARVRALLRRSIDWQSAAPGSALQLDEVCMEAQWHGHSLDLTPVEFRLLRTLGKRPGQVYARAQLLDIVYVADHVVSDRTIDSHIKNLRRKLLEITPDATPIESVYGIGYKFNG
jgi:two-component system, OmpR family, response regulator BaeR